VRGDTLSRPQVQAYQHPLGIGEIADDFPHWLGEFAYQCGDREDLIPLRQLGMLEQIDDLDVVIAIHMLFAEPFQIGESG